MKESRDKMMNRILKFRAWHTKLNKMFSAIEMGRDELCLNPDGRGFVNVNGKSTSLSMYYPEMIPMQFTGLLDKNGKKIYEGDIVKIDDDFEQWGAMAGELREIYYNRGGFRVKPKAEQRGNGHWLESSLEYEIIGNIYENPELLKEATK
jgi:uncharacterized phage protein (TIGR01671 family)